MINPLNTELNPICHLLALLGAHRIFHISRIRVKQDTFLSVKTVFRNTKNYGFLNIRPDSTGIVTVQYPALAGTAVTTPAINFMARYFTNSCT
jgi:hypothetical protein